MKNSYDRHSSSLDRRIGARRAGNVEFLLEFGNICHFWVHSGQKLTTIERLSMTRLHRVAVSWTGGPVVGAAVTVLHFSASDNPAPPVAAIKSAFDALVPALPNTVSVQVPNAGDTIEDTTGALDGVWAGPSVAPTIGSGGANAAAGVGACIGWTTGGIVSGTKGPRKLRGRTFIVPLHSGCYEGNGTLLTAIVGTLDTFATALQAAGPLAIWHRPTSLAAADGNSYGVISHRVRDKVAFLSSRRD